MLPIVSALDTVFRIHGQQPAHYWPAQPSARRLSSAQRAYIVAARQVEVVTGRIAIETSADLHGLPIDLDTPEGETVERMTWDIHAARCGYTAAMADRHAAEDDLIEWAIGRVDGVTWQLAERAGDFPLIRRRLVALALAFHKRIARGPSPSGDGGIA